jgi:putative Ca2+/H+ antiporter (TMEM165/GDT1 family)
VSSSRPAICPAVAVALGKAASLLPDTPVQVAAMLMFLVGAVLLLREARTADAEEAEQEREYAERAGTAHGLGPGPPGAGAAGGAAPGGGDGLPAHRRTDGVRVAARLSASRDVARVTSGGHCHTRQGRITRGEGPPAATCRLGCV